MADGLEEIEKEAEAAVAKVGGFFSEFWAFAAKGNIMDLAIGVMIGTAFSAIVNSLVSNILMPVLSLGTGNINLQTLAVTLRPAIKSAATTTPAVVIGYGTFLQYVINFIIVALSIFMFVKIIGKLRERLIRKEEAQQKAAPATPISTEEKLLCEIRDLLKEQIDHIKPNHEHLQ